MKPVGTQIIAEFLHCRKEVLNDHETLEAILTEGIRKCGLTFVSITSHCYSPLGITTIAVISESHVAVHTYPEARHASIDVFTCSPQREITASLLQYLIRAFEPTTTRVAEISRGNPMEVAQTDWILNNADAPGFDVRYHVKKRIFSGLSRYQQIDIIENENFGRMLFLNQDLQIAESDAFLYNESLIRPLVDRSRTLGHVAILGGGDGGTLRELLKHGPEKVTLVDIDRDVIEASKKHLPMICGKAFDDPRLTLVCEDVYRFLDGGGAYDAIVYDLTMNPEAFIAMDREDYLGDLFRKIRDSLVPGGTITLQCCSAHDETTRRFTEDVLSRFFTAPEFTVRTIPSFLSPWIFARAQRGS